MRSVVFIVTLTLLTGAVVIGQQDARELAPRVPIVRDLAATRKDVYRLSLAASQFARVIAIQNGVDLQLRAIGPSGDQLIVMDREEGMKGVERVSIIAGAAGEYRVEVTGVNKDAVTGKYEIWLDELREATVTDRTQVAAERTFARGRELHQQPTAAAKRQAVSLYQEALPLWRAAGDRAGEATTLHNLGDLHKLLDEYAQADVAYEEALTLRRALGDQHGEAATLLNIGANYYVQGHKDMALDYFMRALPLWKTVGDPLGEVPTLNNIAVVYGSIGEYQKALIYHRQALPLRQAIGDRVGEALTLNNLGMIYRFLDENDKALAYYSRAQEIRRQLDDRRGEGITLNNMAAVYDELGEFDKALDLYNRSLDIKRALGDKRGEASTLNNVGEAFCWIASSGCASGSTRWSRIGFALRRRVRRTPRSRPSSATSMRR